MCSAESTTTTTKISIRSKIMKASLYKFLVFALCLSGFISTAQAQNIAVKADKLHTSEGPAIENGVVLIRDGKIQAVGKASDLAIPDGYVVHKAKVATPGFIDAHTVVGLAGIYNQDHDQDQLEKSDPIQPELRAIDAYNAREELVGYLRTFGITTIHTGHGPGALISGQTMIAKTAGETVDEGLVNPMAMV